jgi:hypothetical protein
MENGMMNLAHHLNHKLQIPNIKQITITKIQNSKPKQNLEEKIFSRRVGIKAVMRIEVLV